MGKDLVVITGGHVVDPANNRDGSFDLLIEGEIIKGIDKPGSFSAVKDATVIDAKGKLVTPGLLDIHVHFREPGFEWKETIETGSNAAVAGGFTTVCCMPNTNPVNDNEEVTKFMLEKALECGKCEVLPIGAISVGSDGKALAPLMELQKAGCVAFSDDGRPVYNAGLMRRALEYSLIFGGILTVHEEEPELSHGFSMNESALSLQMGLVGMPGASEDVMISRDIELARLTGGRVHFCHVSTSRGVTLIRRAKEDGIPVTAETAPHYFTLTESAVEGYNTNAKMSMPLRSAADVEGVMQGIVDGTLDCIASDHAPHERDSKTREFAKASFGILGLQTTVPLTLQKVAEGKLSLQRAIAALTTEPARCFKLRTPSLSAGALANIAVIDAKKKFVVSEKNILSKSKNTPFLGQELTGTAIYTFYKGKKVFDYSEVFGS